MGSLRQIPQGFQFDQWDLVHNSWAAFLESIVGLQYFTLTKVQPNARIVVHATYFSSWISKVKLDRLSHGSAETQPNTTVLQRNHTFLWRALPRLARLGSPPKWLL